MEKKIETALEEQKEAKSLGKFMCHIILGYDIPEDWREKGYVADSKDNLDELKNLNDPCIQLFKAMCYVLQECSEKDVQEAVAWFKKFANNPAKIGFIFDDGEDAIAKIEAAKAQVSANDRYCNELNAAGWLLTHVAEKFQALQGLEYRYFEWVLDVLNKVGITSNGAIFEKYKAAAKSGDMRAQFCLAIMYAKGIWTKKNPGMATKCFKKFLLASKSEEDSYEFFDCVIFGG